MNNIILEQKSLTAGYDLPPLTQANPNLVVIYIGKKVSKIRRSPKRSREQLSPECHVSAERHTHGRRDFHSSSKKSEDHDDDDDDDLADKPAKHLGKPEKSTHNAWDDDWNNVDEHLRACARAKHMAIITSELDTREAQLWAFGTPCKNAGRHYVCAQAQSCKPSAVDRASKPETRCGNAGQHDACAQAQSFKHSVEAKASQHEKRLMNTQKQIRRRLRRRQQLDVAHGKRKEKCCLVDALRAFGFKVSYDRDGPFWVLEDGSEMLRLFGYIISPVSRICNAGPGRWLVCRDGHCIALQRKGEGSTWIFDGADRRRVAASDLNTLMRGAKIFQVPSRLR